MKKIRLIMAAVLYCCITGSTHGAENVQLPEPTKSGGVTLTQALQDRRSSRNFADVDLTPQQLSDLLWSTAGVNRPDGKKVYAVARNRHDMTVYAVTRQGVYRYEPAAHTLTLVLSGDHRAKTGTQPYVGKAAVNLAYVQDINLWPSESEAGKELGFAHAGEMAQNAYLYSAGQDWSATIRGLFEQETLRELLQLSDGQFVRLVHSIGP